MKKLPLWKDNIPFKEASKNWDDGAQEASLSHPLKAPKSLPSMIGITEETKKNLKWKSLKWIFTEDKSGAIRKNILKHPFKYGIAFLKSILKKKPYVRKEDLFFYGISDLEAFQKLLSQKNTFLVLGFSYCHKPHECPSGRFSTECIHDSQNPICRQCYIGKCLNAAKSCRDLEPLLITTIHYIGEQIFKAIESNPNKKVIFIITACEMTLEMFGDLGNMVGIQGIGVRLGGRICNTMKAFELSEKGIKPGLTVVLDATQEKILELIRLRIESQNHTNS